MSLTLQKPEKVRLNLELSQAAKSNLERLQVRTESPSAAEVIRRSLSLLEVVTSHAEKGGTIVLRHPDGKEEIIRLL